MAEVNFGCIKTQPEYTALCKNSPRIFSHSLMHRSLSIASPISKPTVVHITSAPTRSSYFTHS